MLAVTTVVVSITIVMNVAIVIGDGMGATFVVMNSREVGVPDSWLPTLAILKAVGAAGLVAGLVGLPLIGVLAASGLTLFYLGALIAHVRERVFHSIAFPTLFFVFSLGSLALLLAASSTS